MKVFFNTFSKSLSNDYVILNEIDSNLLLLLVSPTHQSNAYRTLQSQEAGGGDEDLSSLQQPIHLGKRAPFSSWAGKRAPFSSWAGKRAPFSSWAGKRAPFR